MKRKTLTKWFALTGLVAGLASPLMAQGEEGEKPDRPDRPERPERRPGGPGGPGGQPRGLFPALDTNKDGKLDQGELDMAVANLRKLDKNEDGEITPEEIFGGRPPGGEGSPGRRPGGDRPGGDRRGGPEMLSRLDTDKDGKISKEEAPERMAQNWDRVDTNGDGFLDKEEQTKMFEAMRRRGPDGGGNPQRPQRGRPQDEGDGSGEKPKRPAPAEE